jgi:hypothetical protein
MLICYVFPGGLGAQELFQESACSFSLVSWEQGGLVALSSLIPHLNLIVLIRWSAGRK